MSSNLQIAEEFVLEENQVRELKPNFQVVHVEGVQMGLCMTCSNLALCKLPNKGKGVLFCEEFD